MFRSRLAPFLGVRLGVVVWIASVATFAQQPRGGGPPAPGAPAGRGQPTPGGRGAPLGVARDPLGDGPWVFDTAEQHKLRVVVGRARACQPVEPRVPARRRDARHRASGPAAHHPQRRARPSADRRCSSRRSGSVSCGLMESRCIRDSPRTGRSTSPTASRATRALMVTDARRAGASMEGAHRGAGTVRRRAMVGWPRRRGVAARVCAATACCT